MHLFSKTKNSVQSDKQLLFNEVYQTNWKALFRSAFHFLKEEQDAEDVVQETFVRLWEHWDTISHINLKGWLFTTSYRITLKKIKKNNQLSNLKPENLHLISTSVSDTALEQKQLVNSVEECVNNLPDKCREVFRMSREENLPHKEIASKLDISCKTVEYHISFALKRIRAEINSII